jgi:Leucine-rich repeat (LRR) protein
MQICNKGVRSMVRVSEDIDPQDKLTITIIGGRIDKTFNIVKILPQYSIVGYQVENKRVVTLGLYGCKLNQFPPELLDLTELRLLNLWATKIDRVPPEIARLCHLENLNLESNGLKHLPEELFELPLHRLYLGNNSLTALSASVGKLSKTLVYLNLFHNRLKTLPRELFSCTLLETLGLAENSSLQSIPEEICQLTALRTLTYEGIGPECLDCLKSLPNLKTKWAGSSRTGGQHFNSHDDS